MPDPVNWSSLAQSIADGEAALVLGQDAIPFYPAAEHTGDDAEMSFSELSRERILASMNSEISHFYRRDNLFHFNNAPAKQQAMKCVRDAARDRGWLPDAELLRQLVALPFPVVLSVNPDKYLFDAFCALWRQPQFDYFTTKDKPQAPILSYPTSENPLLYNLCGSVTDKLDSCVLDYSDLFELIKNLLVDHGVPDVLWQKLQEVDRYILVGFDLERWYFQIILHYLNRLENNPFSNFKQNFPILSKASGATREFVLRQFNVEQIAPSRNDLEKLYLACRDRGILRTLNDFNGPIETNIRQLAVQNKFEEAFALLEAHAPDASRALDIPQLRARYTAWLQGKNSNTVKEEDLNLEINRIRYTLLTFAHQLTKT